eukprot:CAMPEP_0182496278 /NCGR_PEP_ID=MMETSP1321-20130603/4949_1 /TAXON_ID=91990 /ORGANISM="Bolidomonas sp., Strain RCC1657" /LENGTH=100 /DNA_ID=CAMNT_0024699859 /DNA_START=399 /DNA_END=698 /DNA_ORIENTATION=+
MVLLIALHRIVEHDQPLVPIGSLITLGFLTSGLKSFVDGKAMRSQQMMRGRVLAQGVTVVAILGYAAANGFKQEKKILTTAERDAAVLAAWPEMKELELN